MTGWMAPPDVDHHNHKVTHTRTENWKLDEDRGWLYLELIDWCVCGRRDDHYAVWWKSVRAPHPPNLSDQLCSDKSLSPRLFFRGSSTNSVQRTYSRWISRISATCKYIHMESQWNWSLNDKLEFNNSLIVHRSRNWIQYYFHYEIETFRTETTRREW